MLLASIIPSHTVADWLLKNIDRFLDFIGLGRFQTLEEVIYLAIIIFASFAIGWIVRKAILWCLQKILKVHDTVFTRELLRQHTLTTCSHVITPIVFLALVPFAFESSAAIHRFIVRAAMIYLSVMIGVALTAVMKFTFDRLNAKENTKGLPLQGILNICIGILWGVLVIVCVSILVNKSPAALLGGLTAFAAVLMLVFKDTILGFVAGIQMSQNDMVRVGDWIVVPSTLANGTVEDVSLSTVKVRNFDNTIVTVPPYTLVSQSFQNWRGMSESGVRRISENVYINPDSIEVPSAERITALCEKYPSIKDFVDRMQKEDQPISWQKGVSPINGSLETNLGLYRAYLTSYLVASPLIDPTKDLMVNIATPTAEGIPVKVYCFSVTTQWQAYVAVLSGIMEHALMAAADFNLEVLSADHLSITQSERSPQIQQAPQK